MSRPEHEKVQSDSDERYLSVTSIGVHNNHLQSGVLKTRSCRVCAEGLGGIVAKAAPRLPNPEPEPVVESNGADKKGDPPYAPGDWVYQRDPDQVLRE